MAFQGRKLLSDSEDSSSETCLSIFCVDSNSSGYCPTACLTACSDVCRFPMTSPPPPPPPPTSDITLTIAKTHKFSPVVVYLLSFLSFFFVMVLLFAYYRRSRSRRLASAARSPPSPPESNGEFVDEEEGPILDHPIWYIRTVGLQPSLISAIPVCKYKPGDGLVDGTDCSVCLTEFEEDEDLRLLPKCSHAFHLPCIDTWLRSHTNCPLCRASVAAVALRSESPPVVSGPEEEVSPENSQNMADSGDREDNDELAVIEVEAKRFGESSGAGEELQPMRRSVSLDSLSAFVISSALSGALEMAKMSSNQNGKTKIPESLVSASSSMKRSLSCTSKFFQRTLSTQRKHGVIPR